MALLPNGHRAVAGAERGVPGDADGILHALVRGTALDVDGQRTLRSLHSVRGHREVVVHVDRPDPDRLADPDDASLDGGLVGLAVERDLAPCQGASPSAVHSASDGGDDVIERRGDRRPLLGAAVLAYGALAPVHDGFA